jgi:hydrogenase maturation protease
MPNARTLLLGLGNDLLTDDGIGLRVAAAVRQRLPNHPRLTVLQTTEMGLALLDMIVGFDELVLVDSIQTHQSPPGTVHELDAGDLHQLPLSSPHFIGIGEMLALGRQLGMAVPQRVKIFAIEVQDPFTISTDLTPTLRAALPGIVERVAHALPPPA